MMRVMVNPNASPSPNPNPGPSPNPSPVPRPNPSPSPIPRPNPNPNPNRGQVLDAFMRKPYDLLDYHKSHFDRDYLEFNANIQELEG